MTATYQDLTKKNTKELQALLAEGRGALHELTFKQSIGQLKNVREITTTRATIARILTALNVAEAANAALSAQR